MPRQSGGTYSAVLTALPGWIPPETLLGLIGQAT
jgi:hypothetical protein